MTDKVKLFIKILLVVGVACLLSLLMMKACRTDESAGGNAQGDEPAASGAITETTAPAQEDHAIMEKPEKADVVASYKTTFDNSKQLSYQYAEGKTITVGLSSSEDADGLYLNVISSSATAANPVGFYMTADGGYLMYPAAISEYEERAALTNRLGEGNLILGRTYDRAISSRYVDTQSFGCKWTNDMPTGGTIFIRAIDLSEMRLGQMLATFCVDVEYNEETNQYTLARAYDSDVLSTDALSEEERGIIVADAIDFMRNPERNARAVVYAGSERSDTDAIWAAAEQKATVEKVPMTYFTELYDKDGKAAKRRDYLKCDIYAVSFPLTGFGFVTLYYAPELQLLGMASPYAPGSNELNLGLFGFDAFYPFTKDTLNDAGFNIQ